MVTPPLPRDRPVPGALRHQGPFQAEEECRVMIDDIFCAIPTAYEVNGDVLHIRI
jgi:ligand-binding SRPBCC domain-containing protein